jgi:L-aminopeptidase/D-esterase-like protein
VITDISGLRVGHWTDTAARTGCTVTLFPDGTVASGDLRGGAPATRDFELLDPRRTVDRIDAVVLTGGSAFGLAAADGAMRFCEERGLGFATPAGPVPIVVALGLFDLGVGDPRIRPGADQGYAACEAATDGPVELGTVGAGAGATVAKLGGAGDRRPGGLVSAGVRSGDLRVATLVAVNAVGVPGAEDQTALDKAAAPHRAGRPGDGKRLRQHDDRPPCHQRSPRQGRVQPGGAGLPRRPGSGGFPGAHAGRWRCVRGGGDR